MNFKELQKAGAFVSTQAVKKTITWTRKVDGKEQTDTFDIYIKRMSAGSAEKLFSNVANKSMTALTISEYIRASETGNEPVMTYDQAYQLDPTFAHVLIDAINEVITPKN